MAMCHSGTHPLCIHCTVNVKCILNFDPLLKLLYSQCYSGLISVRGEMRTRLFVHTSVHVRFYLLLILHGHHMKSYRSSPEVLIKTLRNHWSRLNKLLQLCPAHIMVQKMNCTQLFDIDHVNLQNSHL